MQAQAYLRVTWKTPKITTGVSVMDLLGDRIVDAILTTSSLLFSVLIAFPIGIISAIKQYSKLDYSVATFSFLGLSMPTFLAGPDVDNTVVELAFSTPLEQRMRSW